MVPFLVGVAAFTAIDFTRFEGTAQNRTALLLVFAIAIAVTSIPVISRIMLDLGLLQTRFARIVLSVAVIEDVVLYVVLAVAIGIVAGTGSAQFGLAGQLGLGPWIDRELRLPHVRDHRLPRRRAHVRAAPLRHGAAFALQRHQAAQPGGVPARGRDRDERGVPAPQHRAALRGVRRRNHRRHRLGRAAQTARFEIGNFSLGLFIPLYFAIVGLQLDLVDNFDVLFFVAFLLFACLVKSASVYAGARIGGEPRKSAVNLAMAMNARGGPGIVLASTAFAAGIINDSFYTTLVMLAIVTSLIAGTWLQRVMTAEPAPVHDSADALVTG